MFLFLTAYDPLAGSSGSIDPLGALQTYGTLADMLLPGVTTITNRSRYLSMLCSALANAEKQRRFLPGSSGLAQRRKAVEPFERLWALACVAGREHGFSLAADGLRGVTYAEKSYRDFAIDEKPVNPDFPLLKYQSRTGAVGTYWTTMIGGELVDPNTGNLTHEGHELAERFPLPPLMAKDLQRLADPDIAHRVSMLFDDLLKWAKVCHLDGAGTDERKQIGDALTADDRRERMSRALLRMAENSGLPELWDVPSLQLLRQELDSIPAAVNLGLTQVLDAVLVTEIFHEAVLTIFQTLLWWGTKNSSEPLDNLFTDRDFRKSTDRCRETALFLRQFRDECERSQIREAINGLVSFAYDLDRATTVREVVSEILRRHNQVQSGKVDGGMQKRDWIVFDGNKLLRPSSQFQQNERPSLAAGMRLTHPYRMEPFIYMLRENDVIPRAEQF